MCGIAGFVRNRSVYGAEDWARIAAAMAPFEAMALTSLHVLTTLTGSAILALAHAAGRISAEAA